MGLQADQCLRYDFKAFKVDSGANVGMSSVLCSVSELASKPGFDTAAKEYVDKYVLYVINTNSKMDGQITKQMAIMCKDAALCEKASSFLQSFQDSVLQLELIDDAVHEGFVRRSFRQKNIAASRKQ